MKKIIIYIIMCLVIPVYGATPKSKSKAKTTVNAEEVLAQGREAFFNYDFEKAADLYDEYRTLKTKAKQEPSEDFEIWETQLQVAANAFDKVQKIEIVDSLVVPADKFFESYKLAKSAGRIFGGNTPDVAGIGFENEWGDYRIQPESGEDGELILKEKRKLLDGSWVTLDALEGDFEKSGDYAYPFMSGDGQTLYFANNGDESMGGFDIFVAQKEPITGEVRQPLNLGMPFNSPYDDFMMAVDEQSGLGWWATNRNSEDGEVRIFVYKLVDVRENYPADTEDLVSKAKLD